MTNMPKHLTKEDLSAMLKKDSTAQVLRINVVEADITKPNHAFVVCPTREAANSVVKCLHEKTMGQLSLMAQLHNGVLQICLLVCMHVGIISCHDAFTPRTVGIGCVINLQTYICVDL